MAYRSEFPRICVALGCAEAGQLEKLARQACEAGEEFLEFRLDLLSAPVQGLRTIRKIRAHYPDVQVLVTCRRKANGGGFRGSAEEEWRLIEAAVEAGAQAVDLEVETAGAAPQRAGALRERARVIVSYHNFRSTPAPGPVLRRLHAIPADIYKLVTMAQKPSDNLRVLQSLASARGAPVVAFAMGPFGVLSRVLSVARRAPFTFGAPAADAGTAPGQVPSAVLRRQYRVERHTPDTQVFGVIAHPVGHSISPALHNRAFQARRFDGVYLPLQVEPRHLADFMKVVRDLPIAGFSVTIPHKQRVVRHLAAVDPEARRIGAVNTVYRKRGRLRGTNTDVAGVVVPLEKRLKLKSKTVLIAGNGGAARSAAFALADKGAKVFLTGRNSARVRDLARLCEATALEPGQVRGRGFDVLVHATPVGMFPRTDECYFRDEIPGELVFDMVYNPLETRLVKNARQAGKKVICGLEMFLEQAAAQFEIWTGMTAPRLAMETAAREALGAKPDAA
jgi:3-dehydroquinate dehydratase/shikimate dehydrogenase